MGTGGSLFVLSVVLSRGCQDKALEQESHRGRCSEPFWLSVATRKEGVLSGCRRCEKTNGNCLSPLPEFDAGDHENRAARSLPPSDEGIKRYARNASGYRHPP